MSSPATVWDYGGWRFAQLQAVVDEFFADPDGLEDVAELEHAALVLRAPFDGLGAPAAVASDLALVLERHDDELAAGMLATLATFSHQPLAREAANALARLSARGRISPLAGQIGTLQVTDASCHSLPEIDVVLSRLQRPSESRAQVAMLVLERYPCGPVISHLEVTPPRSVASAGASLRAQFGGSMPTRLDPPQLLERLGAAAEHMDAHAIPLDSEAAVWLPVLARALTGSASALPRLAVAQPESADDRAAGREPLDRNPAVAGNVTRRSAGDRAQAKRRAARAARRRNRR